MLFILGIISQPKSPQIPPTEDMEREAFEEDKDETGSKEGIPIADTPATSSPPGQALSFPQE